MALAEQAGQDSSSALDTGLVVFDLALECEVEGFVEQNVNQIAQFIDPCVSSSSAETHRMLAKVVATAMTKKMRTPEDLVEKQQEALTQGDQQQSENKDTNATDGADKKEGGDDQVAVKTEPIDADAKPPAPAANTGSQGQPPTQVSASALLSPEAKILRLKNRRDVREEDRCRNHRPTGVAKFAIEQPFAIRCPCLACRVWEGVPGGFGSLFACTDQVVIEVDTRVEFSFGCETATAHLATTILAKSLEVKGGKYSCCRLRFVATARRSVSEL